MLACFEASRHPSPQPQVLIHVPLNFCPKSLPQLAHRLYVSPLPLPKSPFPVFPFSSRLSRPYSLSLSSNLQSIRMAFSPGSLTPLRPRSHRRRRRRTRRRAQTTEGGTALSPPLTRSFLRSLSFNGKGCSCVLPPSHPRLLCATRSHVERRQRRRISPWGKGEG